MTKRCSALRGKSARSALSEKLQEERSKRKRNFPIFYLQNIMKSILLVIMAGATAWGQSAWSGSFNSQGSMLRSAAGFTNVALPDPSLLRLDTTVASSLRAGSTVTIWAAGWTLHK